MIPLPLIEMGQAIIAAVEHQGVGEPLSSFVVGDAGTQVRFEWTDAEGWLVELA